MHPVRRPHLHLPPRARTAATLCLPPSRRPRTPQAGLAVHGPLGPHGASPQFAYANTSSQRRATVQSCRGHITRQRGQDRSFVQANDMPKRNLGRDPREIRFHRGVVMTNGCASRPVRITRQVKQEFSRGGIFAGISLESPLALRRPDSGNSLSSCHVCEDKNKCVQMRESEI